MRDTKKNKLIDFGDRLVVGVVGACLAAVTLAAYPFALMLFFRRAAIGVVPLIFSKIGLATILAAFFVGFAVGPDKMAAIFSFFWGTHPVWKQELRNQRWWVIAVVVILALVVVFSYARVFDQMSWHGR